MFVFLVGLQGNSVVAGAREAAKTLPGPRKKVFGGPCNEVATYCTITRAVSISDTTLHRLHLGVGFLPILKQVGAIVKVAHARTFRGRGVELAPLRAARNAHEERSDRRSLREDSTVPLRNDHSMRLGQW